MMKIAAVLALAVLMALSRGVAGSANAASTRPPVQTLVVKVDWQGPLSLPRRFRNHCRLDVRRRLTYCSDHCGRDYQFYFCTRGSFGCCRIGYGYCDWNGLLRCAP